MQAGPRVGWMPSAAPSSLVRVGGCDGVGDEIQLGRRGRAVGLDYRKVPEVTGVAVGVTGGLHVGVVLLQRAPPTHASTISSAATTAAACFNSTMARRAAVRRNGETVRDAGANRESGGTARRRFGPSHQAVQVIRSRVKCGR